MARGSRKYIVELDGWTYGFSKNRLEQVGGFKDLPGDKIFVADLPDAITRVMTVEAPARYADLMIQRKLQDTGEFSEPVSVISHWKKGRGANSTDILFTALPSRSYNQIMDRIEAAEDVVLFYPLYSVLYEALRRLRSATPAAVVLQHGRYADFIIGARDKVFYANRCVAFDTSEEQVEFLWETVRGEIRTVESDNDIEVSRVFLLSFVDAKSEPAWPEEPGLELFSFEEEAVTYQDEAHFTSLFKTLDRLPVGGSASPRSQRMLYRAKRAAPMANLAILALAALLVLGYLTYQGRGLLLASRIKEMETKIAAIQRDAPKVVGNVDYPTQAGFIRDLDYCRNAPSFKGIVNDISRSVSYGMTMKALKLEYERKKVNIEVYGRFDSSFEAAHKGFQNFIALMRRSGYGVEDSRLTTKITTSEFLLRMSRVVP